jgi:hypothetical protein
MNNAFSTFESLGQIVSFRALPLICFVALASGCGGGESTCADVQEAYREATEQPPLRVPDGLTAPNRSDALAIPEVKASNGERRSCLDEPPSYFRSAGTVARSPEEVVASWAQAWANREADAVVALYSTKFEAPTDVGTSAAWLEQRREQVATGPVPDPMVEDLEVEPEGADRRLVRFVQNFGANSLRKELILIREAGSWRILEERVSEVK